MKNWCTTDTHLSNLPKWPQWPWKNWPQRSLGCSTPRKMPRAWREHLEDCIRSITWVATIDAFQHEIYRNPNLDRDGRTALWLDLDQRFGVPCDWSGLEDIRKMQWQRQLHLFEVPFYYIEYGIAQLGALQLWQRSTSDHAGALNDYKSALRLGGSKPLPELFAAAASPLTQPKHGSASR